MHVHCTRKDVRALFRNKKITWIEFKIHHFTLSALSYNFAVDNYHPLASKKGFLPTPFLDETGHPRDFDWKPIEDEDLESKSMLYTEDYSLLFYVCSFRPQCQQMNLKLGKS